MKALLSYIITAGLSIAIMLFLLSAMTVQAGGKHHHDNDSQTAITNITIKKDKSWQFPVLLIAIGAGACWLYCGDDKPVEPLPNPGPAVKNDVTPDNLKDRPRKFIIEAE